MRAPRSQTTFCERCGTLVAMIDVDAFGSAVAILGAPPEVLNVAAILECGHYGRRIVNVSRLPESLLSSSAEPI